MFFRRLVLSDVFLRADLWPHSLKSQDSKINKKKNSWLISIALNDSMPGSENRNEFFILRNFFVRYRSPSIFASFNFDERRAAVVDQR